jgi:hypothetical protein
MKRLELIIPAISSLARSKVREGAKNRVHGLFSMGLPAVASGIFYILWARRL